MIKPITPAEVASQKASAIPEVVFEIFNELIVRYWDGRVAVVPQDAVVALIVKRCEVPRVTPFDQGWLNAEDTYQAAGWRVEYDKPEPGYNEDYPAVFRFSKP